MQTEELKAAIERAIEGASAIVEDPMGSGDHFRALVVAEAFAGKSRVQQHLMVEAAVKEYRADQRLHALQLRTCTPEEAEKEGLSVPKPPVSLLQIKRGAPPDAAPPAKG